MKHTELEHRKRQLLMNLEAAANGSVDPDPLEEPRAARRRMWAAIVLFVLFECLVIAVAARI